MAITSSNNGSEAVGIINQALEDAGSSVTVSNESGSSVSDKLNEVFGADLLDDSQSGSEWSQAVEDGFDSLEPQPSIDAVVKFLHLSDPHGYASATTKAKDMLASDTDLAFLFVTGDVTAYGSNNGINSNISSDFTAIGDKLLLLAGNHDTYDNKFGTSGTSQQATTNYIKNWLGQRVTYGDQTGVASYWHKDIQLGESSKLRIISMDQYEIDKVRRGSYHTMYSQAQVDWLIGLLKGLSASDYVIIATHEPPVQSPAVPSGQSGDTYPDDYAVAMRPSTSSPGAEKLFVTEGLRAFGNRRNEPSMNLLPQIMSAYMSGSVLTMTYNNYNGNASNPDITINEDFRGINPATFLFYLGGHRHADIAYYLPNEGSGKDWSDQLMLYITCGDKSINYQYDDDLGGTGNSWGAPATPTNTYTYRVNQVTLDFGAKTITVERIGACNTARGRVRTSVTFPFKKS
jgi:hypothetical protein